MIRIAGLRNLSDRLARLNLAESQRNALDHAGQSLQRAVQEALSTQPGGDHTKPWLRTGSLQSSIAYRSDETGAAIGSDDPVATHQELGTRNIPPRPFFSPTAAAHSEEIADQVASTITSAIREATKDAAS